MPNPSKWRRDRLTSVSLVVLVACAQLGVAVSAPDSLAQTLAPNALPTGGTVVRGAASLNQGGTASKPALIINQSSDRAVIDWTTFNIGRDGSVQFVQPGQNASTLNRVLDTNASQIFGRLTSNGQVLLTNPNGVVFGSSATVDTGGLVATTHALSSDDFMAGKMEFNRNDATGKIVNDGVLRARNGGIALLAPEVQNNGVIIARAGLVALASGDKITLNFDPNGSLTQVFASPSTVKSLIDNKKIVIAVDGQVLVSAQAYNQLIDATINNSGSIKALSIRKSGNTISITTSGTITNSGRIKTRNPVADPTSVTLQGQSVINTGSVVTSGSTGAARSARPGQPSAKPVSLATASSLSDTVASIIDPMNPPLPTVVGMPSAGDPSTPPNGTISVVTLPGSTDTTISTGGVNTPGTLSINGSSGGGTSIGTIDTSISTGTINTSGTITTSSSTGTNSSSGTINTSSSTGTNSSSGTIDTGSSTGTINTSGTINSGASTGSSTSTGTTISGSSGTISTTPTVAPTGSLVVNAVPNGFPMERLVSLTHHMTSPPVIADMKLSVSCDVKSGTYKNINPSPDCH